MQMSQYLFSAWGIIMRYKYLMCFDGTRRASRGKADLVSVINLEFQV